MIYDAGVRCQLLIEIHCPNSPCHVVISKYTFVKIYHPLYGTSNFVRIRISYIFNCHIYI